MLQRARDRVPVSQGSLLREMEDIRWSKKQCLEVWVQEMEETAFLSCEGSAETRGLGRVGWSGGVAREKEKGSLQQWRTAWWQWRTAWWLERFAQSRGAQVKVVSTGATEKSPGPWGEYHIL